MSVQTAWDCNTPFSEQLSFASIKDNLVVLWNREGGSVAYVTRKGCFEMPQSRQNLKLKNVLLSKEPLANQAR